MEVWTDSMQRVVVSEGATLYPLYEILKINVCSVAACKFCHHSCVDECLLVLGQCLQSRLLARI